MYGYLHTFVQRVFTLYSNTFTCTLLPCFSFSKNAVPVPQIRFPLIVHTDEIRGYFLWSPWYWKRFSDWDAVAVTINHTEQIASRQVILTTYHRILLENKSLVWTFSPSNASVSKKAHSVSSKRWVSLVDSEASKEIYFSFPSINLQLCNGSPQCSTSSLAEAKSRRNRIGDLKKKEIGFGVCHFQQLASQPPIPLHLLCWLASINRSW